MEQPWLDEASRMNPYTYNITINARTARKKGMLTKTEYKGRRVKDNRTG